MLHLELMYAWTSGLYKTFLLSQGGTKTYAEVSFNQGLQHPFLMRQILATSALSTSLKKPERRDYYHQHAVQLQSEALSGFNLVLKDLNESNIVAAFLVSSLVGLHSFCETFSFRGEHFNDTIDAFIGCINLLRGVRSIIGDWWPFLLSTELHPILELASYKRVQGKNQSYELDALKELIQSADIGLISRKAYEETIDELEQVYASQIESRDPEAAESANMIFAWLVLTPKEYVELLTQRRPEALVILAYYAVVLHQRRQFWAINDAGEFLISGISTHLGKHWDQWLAQPKSVLQDDVPR